MVMKLNKEVDRKMPQLSTKYLEQNNATNLVELITYKSVVPQTPKISEQRRI